MAVLASALLPFAANATNGYFSHGYGARGEGQAGVGTAWAQDALAATAGNEWSGFAAYGRGHSVDGSGSIPPGSPPAGFGGGNVDVHLKETIVGISYAWKI